MKKPYTPADFKAPAPKPFTPAAIKAATKASQTVALLLADLQDLNLSLTTGTSAERLAHAVLVALLSKLHPVSNALNHLASIMEDNR